MDIQQDSASDSPDQDTGSDESAEENQETGDSTQSEVQSPETKQAQQAQQTQAMIKRLKLKVDGEEFEEDYDLSNEDQLKRDLQLARAAKKRMSEAQGLKKEAYQIIEAYKNDPAGLLKALGPKGYDIAEQLLVEKLQAEAMTPEQRQMAELQQRIAKYEQQEKLAKQQEEQRLAQAEEMRYAQHYQEVIIGALDKTGLPKEPALAKRAAALLKQNLALGLELDAEDLAQELKKEVIANLKAVAGSAEANQILELLGPELAKKIRKHDLEQIKNKRLQGTKSLTQSAMPKTTKSKGYMSPEEWQEEIQRRLQEAD